MLNRHQWARDDRKQNAVKTFQAFSGECQWNTEDLMPKSALRRESVCDGSQCSVAVSTWCLSFICVHGQDSSSPQNSYLFQVEVFLCCKLID